jgi:hypothetical protein
MRFVAFFRRCVRRRYLHRLLCLLAGTSFPRFLLFLSLPLFLSQVLASQMAGPFERTSKTVIQVAGIVLATNGMSASAAIVRSLRPISSFNLTPLTPPILVYSAPPSFLVPSEVPSGTASRHLASLPSFPFLTTG